MRASSDRRLELRYATAAQVTLEEFNDFLRGQVATYKLPERLEIFSELPFTPTGKIQRFLLQNEIETRDRAATRIVP